MQTDPEKLFPQIEWDTFRGAHYPLEIPETQTASFHVNATYVGVEFYLDGKNVSAEAYFHRWMRFLKYLEERSNA